MSLFTMLPIVVPDPTLPVIGPADMEYFTEYDPTSYDHWIFDKGGAAGLAGRRAGKALTVQSVAPTYSGSYLSMSNTAGKALLTDLADSATAVDTICAVVRDDTVGITAGKVPFGTLGSSAELTGGCPFFTQIDRDVYVTYRGTSAASVDTGQNASLGNWYFLAVARDFSAATKVLRLLLGGSALYQVNPTGTYTPAPAGRNIACGNGWYTSAHSSNLSIAEFIVFDRCLSAADLAAVYARSKARMAARGITVV